MPRTFISFLGAVEYYKTCYYSKADRSDLSAPIYYVQEAILANEGKPWEPDESIWIFTTEEAENKNYINRFTKTKTFINDGLQSRLAELKKSGRINHFESEEIPNGYTEQEIWQIFEKVISKLKKGDEVIIDITFGFRSLPMLVLVLANYAKAVLNVKVKAIYYGNYESGRAERDKQLAQMRAAKLPCDDLDNLKNSPIQAPILNLSAFAALQDWTYAAQSFLFAGNAEQLSELTQDTHPLFSREIHYFTQSILTCRGSSLIRDIDVDNLKLTIDNLGKDSKLQEQLKPLLERIQEKILPFKSNSILNGFAAVQWSIDHGLIQQGITFLLETLITLPIEHIISKDQINNNAWRTVSKTALLDGDIEKSISKKKIEQLGISEEGFLQICHKMKLWIQQYPELTVEVKKLTGEGFRNDINHCGFRDTPKDPSTLKSELIDVFQNVKKIINKNMN